MSKASEWAKTINDKPTVRLDMVFEAEHASAMPVAYPGGRVGLSVRGDGGGMSPHFSAREALALADWIIDTFGEARR